MKRVISIYVIIIISIICNSCLNKSYYNLFSSSKSWVKKGYLVYLNDLNSSKRLLDKDGYPLTTSDKDDGFVFLSEKCQFSNGKLANFEGDVIIMDVAKEEQEQFFKYAKKLYDNIKPKTGKQTAYGLPVKIIFQSSTPAENEKNPKMLYNEEMDGTFIYGDTKYSTKLKFGYMLVEYDWDWMETHTNYKDLKISIK